MQHVEIPGPFAEHLRAIARGKKELPNCPGERHHYVPEFLIRRFRSRSSAGRKLFQLDKIDGTCEETTPARAAWDPNLYAVESTTGEHDGIVEGLFSLAENYAAQSLRVFLSDPESLSEEDRANLAFLLAIQEQRAPGFLAEQEDRLEQMGTMLTAVELANIKGASSRRHRGMEAYHALVEGRVRMRPSKGYVLTVTLEALDRMTHLIRALPWTLLRTADGSFVCSDRPLTMHDPAPPHKWSGLAWLSSETVAATMPLSSTACLRVSPADWSHLAVRTTERQVDRINLRTYGWATRYVYGPSLKVLESLHERALAHPEGVPSPTKKRAVLLEDPRTADPDVAARNVARGWESHLVQRQQDGSFRTMSYEVIDSIDDARRAVSPRSVTEE
jgi:hypothetical protein